MCPEQINHNTHGNTGEILCQGKAQLRALRGCTEGCPGVGPQVSNCIWILLWLQCRLGACYCLRRFVVWGATGPCAALPLVSFREPWPDWICLDPDCLDVSHVTLMTLQPVTIIECYQGVQHAELTIPTSCASAWSILQGLASLVAVKQWICRWEVKYDTAFDGPGCRSGLSKDVLGYTCLAAMGFTCYDRLMLDLTSLLATPLVSKAVSS